MNEFLAGLDSLLLYVFAFCALIGSILVVLLRQPMRVATALISTMIFLGGVYGLLGVHFIAAFQVLIYVGAVMVFMVYVIMLLDPRDPALRSRFSPLVVPGIIGGLLLAWALVHAVHGLLARRRGSA
jgi:NADH-quinone oxidoreductase subunit J